MSNTLYRFVKASERSPEPKPEMDNNKEYSFHCVYDGKKVVLYFWSFNWWGERYDGEIYGISEKVFNQLYWQEEVKEADQQELWEEIKKDISTADKAHVPLKLIDTLKNISHLKYESLDLGETWYDRLSTAVSLAKEALVSEPSPSTAIREEAHTPASREEIIDKYLSNWLKNVSVEHEAEVKAVRGQIVAAMQEFSQAKEKEIDFWKKEYAVYKDGCHERDEKLTAKEAELKKIEDALLEITEASCKKHEETISELKYYRELAEAAEKLLSTVPLENGNWYLVGFDEHLKTWQNLRNEKPKV